MALFAFERVGQNKQQIGDSIREALNRFASNEETSGASFGKLAGAVEQMIEAFPFLDGTSLIVSVQGTVERSGFGSVSVSIRALSNEVMV